jgi:hypothetical protein
MKRPIESDYTSLTAYTRALEEYCDALAQPEQDCVGWFGYDTGLRLWFETNKGDDDAIPLYKDPQQRKALKLALDALESGVDTQIGRVAWTEYDSCLISDALTAIKEVSAQPEQPWCMKMNGCKTKCEDCPDYAPPEAQRKPLTDEQIETIWKRVQANDFHDCVQPFAKAIEAAHRIKE